MSVEKTQAHILQIMVHFDRYCKEHNLRYYMLGGTLLGAVRHKGFIPWDDDADIGMPRTDYERLINAYNNKEKRYFLASFERGGEFVRPFARLYDRYTTVTFDAATPFQENIWVDIFPLDGAYANRAISFLHIYIITRLKGIFYMRSGRYSSNDHKIKLIIKKIVKWITVAFSKNWPCGLMKRIATLKNFDTSNYVGNLYGRWGVGEIVPKSVFGQGARYQFHDYQFLGPEDADTYLSSVYGDYMTLPEKENRISDHQVISTDYAASKKYENSDLG